MNLSDPFEDFFVFLVRNALLIACLIYISMALRCDPRLLVGLVYIALFICALGSAAVQWMQGKFDEEGDEREESI